MTVLNEENFSEVMADREVQREILRARKKTFVERKVRRSEVSRPEDGWYVHDDTLLRDVKLAKDKPQAEQFEHIVWPLLARMCFIYLSPDRALRLQYDAVSRA